MVWKNEKSINRKINPNKALMIWGGISYYWKTNICINEFGYKVNSQNYTQTLEKFLLPFIALDEQLLHYKGRCDISRFTNSWLGI